MPDVGFFVELETQVWHALVIGDAVADDRCLSEDFLGVYPSGFATRSEHVDQVGEGPSVVDYQLSDTRITVVSAEAVMLSYLATYTRPGNTGEPPAAEAMYVSSLWCNRDGAWINTFSQDTPAD